MSKLYCPARLTHSEKYDMSRARMPFGVVCRMRCESCRFLAAHTVSRF